MGIPLTKSNNELDKIVSDGEWIKTDEIAKVLDLKPITMNIHCNKGHVRSKKVNGENLIYSEDLRILDRYHKLNITQTVKNTGIPKRRIRELDEEVKFIDEINIYSNKGNNITREFVDQEISRRLGKLQDIRKSLGLIKIKRRWLTHLYDFNEDFEHFIDTIDTKEKPPTITTKENPKRRLENVDEDLVAKLSEKKWVSSSNIAEIYGLAQRTIDTYCNKGYVRAQIQDDEWHVYSEDIRFIDICHRLSISNAYIRTGIAPKGLRTLDDEVNFIGILELKSKKGETITKYFIDEEISNRLNKLKKLRIKNEHKRIPREWLTHLYDFNEDFEQFIKEVYEDSEGKAFVEANGNYPTYETSKTAREYGIGSMIAHDTFGLCEVLPRFDETITIDEAKKKYGKFSPMIATDENISDDKYSPMIRVKTEDGNVTLLKVSKE